jgi:hypothetical protein
MLPLLASSLRAFSASSPDDKGLLRAFSHTAVRLTENATLSLINTQASYSADGTVQRRQIAELAAFASQLTGPVIIMGDMQLFADGLSTAAAQAGGQMIAWQPLLAAGFKSVTPLGIGSVRCTFARLQKHQCSSFAVVATRRWQPQPPLRVGARHRIVILIPAAALAPPTVQRKTVGDGTEYFAGFRNVTDPGGGGVRHEYVTTVDYGDGAVRPGYQVDYIFYRGLKLAATDPSIMPGGAKH